MPFASARIISLLSVFTFAAFVSAQTSTGRGPGPRHAALLDASQASLFSALESSGALIFSHDYGAFRVAIVDDRPLGGADVLAEAGFPFEDEMLSVFLNGVALAGDRIDLVLDAFEADEPFASSAAGRSPSAGLYVLKFHGPTDDAWLAALWEKVDAVVSYIPRNAYVVRAEPWRVRELEAFAASAPFVDFLVPYFATLRATPELAAFAKTSPDLTIAVTLQLVRDALPSNWQSTLAACGMNFEDAHAVGPYLDVSGTIVARSLRELTTLPYLFQAEERGVRRRLDEAQAQIIAGNVLGAAPTGPGYLAWLTAHGFAMTAPSTFAVNVVDDADSLTGHPDLASPHVAFSLNPTSQTGAQGGHGFLNAHIIGGLNTGAGAAFEDQLGQNYGLGIAPFVRVGSTAIFGNGSATSTSWERAAYAMGSRISSNSWGYTSPFGGPQARYDVAAQEYDTIVRDADLSTRNHDPLVVVFAAGNDGSGSNTVGSPATAKNVIAVGASENYRPWGVDGCGTGTKGANDARDIIAFSSRGPVNTAGGDGRKKPDLVAPGTHVQAGIPQSNYNGSSVCDQYWPVGQTLYGWSSGTSHSTPAVAGAAAVIRQDALNRSLAPPSPAMTKALLVAGAEYLNGVGAGDSLPSNSQGYGRAHLGRLLDDTAMIVHDQATLFGSTGGTFGRTAVVADPSKELRIVLAWTDAPGPTTGAPYVNDLDLVVTAGGVAYRGNVFQGPRSASGGTRDARNNVEAVILPAGVTGSVTVQVTAAQISGDGVPGNGDGTDQDFALLVWNGADLPAAPNAEFSGQGLTGSAPRTVTFTDLSTGTIGSRLWSFGDGQTSTAAHPTHTYTIAGVYDVTLAVSGPGGSDSETKSGFVSVGQTQPPRLYLSFTAGTSLPGLGSVADDDIVVYDPTSGGWAVHFDGSDVGLGATDIDAFAFLPNGDILLSFDSATVTIPGLSGGPNGDVVTDSDIVRFIPTSLGPVTAGAFLFYFEGADVGLTTSSEDIDTLEVLANGDLLIGTTGDPAVSGLSGLKDEDLLRFSPTSLGAATQGVWSLEFDGSDVGLADSTDEDVDAAALDALGRLIFSTLGTYSASGGAGDDEDVSRFTGSFGATTAGTIALVFDLSALGIAASADVDGIEVVGL